ncbi:MAG TPA: NAD-dependent epimerase/dehydratase family protein [Candidatus Ratteibacteria bacterium]|jgi:nucleoside-diphosphate-sugar epimerase|uniref:NAD dependent epimerase/dehydratase family protein n=1 Tax=candidate division TA06 bacterium ADurb.Bin131 TaxID=1852827 RepID=A0A1V6C9C3_UNCT6|nr:MAG: NAD dependent epimerase/dehydratase family protein [candidate division TA06 bacterium ADurb.Bin131]HOC03072.1 NAD-dependent epimerase/dehydratase family protein [bacterium]HRS05695.1 NAD-dependent epimerase/dehydratase family protein [Candidatus Ratteibacteria bacterium]HON05122.1 NAD-dependent epimerase/dehydratase family protein [bacterium]HOQ82049.1 NAD-dependent epimerase/dehydratase family protein [bacterium]
MVDISRDLPEFIEDEKQLEEILSRPYSEVIEFSKSLSGDIIVLGVAGKMGPSLVKQIKRADIISKIKRRIIGVARFSNPEAKKDLEESGIETIVCDLLDRDAVDNLPEVKNVIFMAGMKFGSTANQSLTWAMNAYVPALIANKYKSSKIVVLSTGNVYPLVPVSSGGSKETDPPSPIGEYAQSCLGRERVFEYFSSKFSIPSVLIRLNYAVELRYGVLYDIGLKVYNNEKIYLENGFVNIVWQGWANSVIFRSFSICGIPPTILNLTGPEILSVKMVAEEFGRLFGKKPLFEGKEAETAYLSDASKCFGLFGKPDIMSEVMIKWIAHWIEKGGKSLNKPTHFEERKGRY